MRGDTSSWDRREVLKLTGASAIGATAASRLETVGAQSSDALITIDDEELELVEADPDAGFNYPYYLYTPERKEHERELPLLVEPNNTGTSTDDFDEHRQRAEQLITEQLPNELSTRLRIPALVPVFPRPSEEPVDWRHYTHQLDDRTLAISGGDLERIDLQLLRMVEHAREHLADRGYPVTGDGILMNGFSASGNFVDRFTMLHPDEVLSVTAGGVNGMPILPLEEVDGRELPYHVGIADVDELIGNSPDLDALDETRQFIYMGGDDENDTIPFDDAWTDDDLRQLAVDVYGEDMIDDRFARSEELYEEAGIDAEFRVYEGVGHTPMPAIDDIVEFHLQTVEEYRSSFVFDVEWPAETVETGVEIPISVDVENVVGSLQTATLALSVANDTESPPIETTDVSIGSGSTETIGFEYTFEEPGEYAVSVDGAYAENSLIVVAGDGSPSDDTEAVDGSNSEHEDPTVEDQPGFGVVQTITALGGVGYLIEKRLSGNE